jgi:hypothetical protein
MFPADSLQGMGTPAMLKRKSAKPDPGKSKDKKDKNDAKSKRISASTGLNRTSNSKRELERAIEKLLSPRNSDAPLSLEQLSSELEAQLEGKRSIPRYELLKALDSAVNEGRLASRYSLVVASRATHEKVSKEARRSILPDDGNISPSSKTGGRIVRRAYAPPPSPSTPRY